MVLIGIWQGLAFGPVTAAGIASATTANAGAASGLVNTAHQLGSSLGVGVLATVSAGAASLAESAATAYTGGTMMLAAALVIVLVLIVAAEFTARRPAGLRHVPRNELAAATRLDMVTVNVARAAGPALAGVIIARWGVPPVFAMTAFAASILAVVLLKWRRPRVTHGEREAFIPALVADGRYVRHKSVVQQILLRFGFGSLVAASCRHARPILTASRFRQLPVPGDP